MISFWYWLGGTIGIFIAGGISALLIYLGYDKVWEFIKKRRKPDTSLYSKDTLNGGKSQIDEKEVAENERRRFEQYREFDKLRHKIISGGTEKNTLGVSSLPASNSESERGSVQNDSAGMFGGDDTSGEGSDRDAEKGIQCPKIADI